MTAARTPSVLKRTDGFFYARARFQSGEIQGKEKESVCHIAKS